MSKYIKPATEPETLNLDLVFKKLLLECRRVGYKKLRVSGDSAGRRFTISASPASDRLNKKFADPNGMNCPRIWGAAKKAFGSSGGGNGAIDGGEDNCFPNVNPTPEFPEEILKLKNQFDELSAAYAETAQRLSSSREAFLAPFHKIAEAVLALAEKKWLNSAEAIIKQKLVEMAHADKNAASDKLEAATPFYLRDCDTVINLQKSKEVFGLLSR